MKGANLLLNQFALIFDLEFDRFVINMKIKQNSQLYDDGRLQHDCPITAYTLSRDYLFVP